VRKRLILLGFGAIALAAVVAVVTRGVHHAKPGEAQAPTSAASAGSHSFPLFATRTAGEHANYSLTYSAKVLKANAPMIALGLQGPFELWTVREDGDGTLIRARFTGHASAELPDADATGAIATLNQGFAQPAYIALDAKGQVTELRFHPGVPRLAQTTWRSLAIAMLQFIPGEPGAKLWQTNEADENGTLVTEYSAAAAGGYDKRKLRYVSAYNPEVKHRVIDSAQHFYFDRARLPSQVSERESLGVTSGSLGVAEMEASVALDLRRTAFDSAAPDPTWLAEAAHFERLDLKESGTPRARQSALDEAMASRMDFEEALLALYPGADGKPQKAAADAFHALMGQLRLSDAPLPRLLEHIKKRGPLRASLLSVLRDAGTPASQAALRDLFADRDTTADDRDRLVRDLSLVKTPTPETLQLLTSLMHDPALGAQAKLGVGANAYELRESAPELSQQAVSTLVQELKQAPDDVQRRQALSALGNSGGETALPDVKPYLSSGTEATQVSATEALRRMPGAETDLLLADLLRHAALQGVRLAAADAIRYRDLTPPLVSALSESLRLEPDARVRGAVISVASFFLQKSSVLRDALIYVAASDPDPKLRAAAQQTLS